MEPRDNSQDQEIEYLYNRLKSSSYDKECDPDADLCSDQTIDPGGILAFRVSDMCRYRKYLDDTTKGDTGIIKIKKIMVTEKKPNMLKKDYWDITVMYIFEEARACGGVTKESYSYSHKVTLYGASNPVYRCGTDMPGHETGFSLSPGPFVLVKAKAVKVKPFGIGLFAEISLFYIVHLL